MSESSDAIARSLTSLFEKLERRDPVVAADIPTEGAVASQSESVEEDVVADLIDQDVWAGADEDEYTGPELSGDPQSDLDRFVMRLGEESEPDLEQLEWDRASLTPEAAEELCRRLAVATPDDEERTRLVRVIRRLGSGMADPLGAAITDDPDRSHRRAYIEGMVALGQAAIPVATRMMDDSRWYVVRNAIDILRDAAGEAGMEYFVSGLAHENPKVRRQAIHALGHVGGETAGMLVPSKISDADADVRKAAAMATGQLRVVRAVKPLLERLDQEPDQAVQVEILLALGRIGDPGAVPAIEKHAEQGLFQRIPTEIRIAAYRALWWIGTPRARKLVRDAERDKNAEVREAVVRIAAAPHTPKA